MPQTLARITDIAFDPGTAGLAYVVTGGAADQVAGDRDLQEQRLWRELDAHR